MDGKKSHLILVYGSLRQAHYNFQGTGNKVIRTFRLPGFALFTFPNYSPYPMIVPKAGSEVTVELQQCPDKETKDSLDAMEKGAGYSLQTVSLPEGDATLYVYNASYDQLVNNNYQLIKSGDWNEFKKVETSLY